MSDSKTAEERPSYTTWCVVLVLTFGISSLSVALFVEGGVGGDVQKLRDRRNALRDAQKRYRRRYRALRRREKRLHHDPYLIEELARDRLGMSRPGEKRVIMESEGSSDTGVVSSSALNTPR